MGILLADDGRVDVADFVSLLHGLHADGDSVGHLVLQQAQSLQLRHDLPHGLVGDGVLVEIGGALGQVLEDALHQLLRIVPLQGGHGHDLRAVYGLAVGVDEEQHLVLLHGIRLVDHQDHRGLHLLQLLDDMPLPGSDEAGGLHQPQNHVHLIQGGLGGGDHVLAQLVLGLVDARRVHKHNLTLLRGQHGADTVAGGLGLVGRNGDLLSYQMVHQRGFSHVRPANQGDKA